LNLPPEAAEGALGPITNSWVVGMVRKTETVLCYDDLGGTTAVPYQALRFQPAVHGLLLERGELLLLTHAAREAWRLPGGLVQAGETPAEAVRSRFHQLTGIMPGVERLLLVEERFYLAADGQGWRLVDIFFALGRPPVPLDRVLATAHDPQPQWVEIAGLQRSQLELGYAAVNLLKQDVR
jgi:ADP-ribose pyrophosphatase YjhB (NUDIX family)